MLSPRWIKVLRDIWNNKTRTLLVVLSIATGVFAVGAIATTQVILDRDLSAAYNAINPADAVIGTIPFDDELVATVRGMKEVSEAEGRRSINIRLSLGDDQWRDLALSVIPNYKKIRISKIRPEQGAWPPPEGELLIERASLTLTNAKVGDKVLVKTTAGKERPMRIAGLVHDINLPPAVFVGKAFGYITPETAEQLGVERNYDELLIKVAGQSKDKDEIQRLATKVRKKLESSGREVFYVWIPTPGQHPANDSVQPILMVLGVLGLLTLGLSGFLVVNTISAIMTQQIRQIGVMKTLGARNDQIMGVYFGLVLVFGLLALIVAAPLGALGARLFAGYLAQLINFDITNFSIPPKVLALEAAIGLLVPLLASIYPVVSGIRVPVREAISNYGLGNRNRFGRSRFDRLIERVQFLPRPLLLSLRNTFRRKGRLALTLVTLTLGGAIFIAVFSVRSSLLLTLDDAYEYWKYDVVINFSQPQHLDQVEQEAKRLPGVSGAESWGGQGVRRLRPDGSDSRGIYMVAPPAQTKLLRPTILEGRWLLPEDENALVINTNVLKDEPDLKVGDRITLRMEGRETDWVIVGLARGVLTGPIVYANYPYYAQVGRDIGRAGSIQAVTTQHDGTFQAQIAKNLEQHFKSLGIDVSSTETTTDSRRRIEMQFNILVVFLVIMAVLLAVVGGLGLMGTMSINVLERTREIGVMRAIGASDWSVQQIFLVEGILIGFISWLSGGIAAIPLSKILSDTVGNSFIKAPLSYTFSGGGAVLWLVLVLMLAALASYLPARNASRVSVREVLAYE